MSDQAANMYLFSFTPLDSFSFSGESSARTKGITDAFLQKAHNAARRQSFRVETDTMPPQTTLMGAVRRIFYGTDIAIGSASFDIANDKAQDMGDIESISAAFLKGRDSKGNEVYCFPAPLGTMKKEKETGKEKEKEIYAPAQPDLYKAKNGTKNGFLVYKANDLSQAPEWHEADSFVKVYEQPVVYIGDNSKADGYHLQCKCRFRNDLFSDLAFCVVVTLKKAPKNKINPMLIALGSRDGRFMAEARKTSFSLTDLSDKLSWCGKDNFWCVSLLSASLLPENWKEFDGLKQAFVATRNMRCAISDAKFSMQLIPQKMVLADKGSVFLFDSEQHRKQFVDAVEANHRTICGLNRVLSYRITCN